MQKNISIIVPIYRDAVAIGSTIEMLLKLFEEEKLDGEVIIVNDGGQDNGSQIVREKMKTSHCIKFIDRKENKGKGFAIREGIGQSSGQTVFYTDADLPYGTESIKQMYYKLVNGEADLILANRNLSTKDNMKNAPLLRKLAHTIYPMFVGWLLFKYSDPSAGLKGMTRKVVDILMPKLTIDRFAFDVELILVSKKNGLNIGEIPVELQRTGKSNLKITADSWQMIKDVLRIAYRNKSGFYDKK